MLKTVPVFGDRETAEAKWHADNHYSYRQGSRIREILQRVKHPSLWEEKMFRIFFVVVNTLLWLFLMSSSCFAFRCDVTATGVAFGVYDVFSNTPNDAVGTITVTCNIPAQTPQAPLLVTIALSPGASGNIAQRQLESARGDRLNYNLYTNASFSSIWGNEGSFAVQTALITRDNPYSGTIYGRMPAQQNVAVGSYRDVIIATINW